MTVDAVHEAGPAVAAARGGGFDVVVMDVMLPGARDGIELSRQLRQDRGPAPILMLTARGAVEDRVRPPLNT